MSGMYEHEVTIQSIFDDPYPPGSDTSSDEVPSSPWRLVAAVLSGRPWDANNLGAEVVLYWVREV